MEKCVYYITGHGYGHATRSFELVRMLISLNYQVIIVSSLNETFIHENLSQYFDEGRVAYESRKLDSGAVQLGPLDLDCRETLMSYCNQVHAHHRQIKDSETRFLSESNAKFIISDVTPIACSAAFEAGLKAFIVSNLSWDCIYEQMVSDLNDVVCQEELLKYKIAIQQIQNDYNCCHHLLQLPGPTPLFLTDSSKVIPAPLLSRPSSFDLSKLCMTLNVPSLLEACQSYHKLLLSFGGHATDKLKLSDSHLPDGWICFLLGFESDSHPHLSSRFIFCPRDTYVPDLVAVCDVVLGKIGYGTVSECLSTTPVTPLVYVPRQGWAEEPALVKLMEWNKACICIARDDFFAGNWAPYLQHALQLSLNAKQYTPEPISDSHAANGDQSTGHQHRRKRWRRACERADRHA